MCRHQNPMNNLKGKYIISHGQRVKVDEITELNGEITIHLSHPIVVPTIEYCRDEIKPNEIQKIVE